VGVAELSAGRVAWATDAEAMSRLGNYGDFSMTFNLESLVPTLKSTRLHPVSEYNAGDKHWLLIVGDVRRYYPSFNSRS